MEVQLQLNVIQEIHRVFSGLLDRREEPVVGGLRKFTDHKSRSLLNIVFEIHYKLNLFLASYQFFNPVTSNPEKFSSEGFLF